MISITTRSSGEATQTAHLEKKTTYNSTTGLLSDPFKYAIDDDYSLTIKSLTIADGGQYTCILVRDCKENSADVIVISKYYI